MLALPQPGLWGPGGIPGGGLELWLEAGGRGETGARGLRRELGAFGVPRGFP